MGKEIGCNRELIFTYQDINEGLKLGQEEPVKTKEEAKCGITHMYQLLGSLR